MSADGKHCECGAPAFAILRRHDDAVREPICGPCLVRITGQPLPAASPIAAAPVSR